MKIKPKSVDPERGTEDRTSSQSGRDWSPKAEERARKAAEDAKRYAEAMRQANESAAEDYTDYNLSSRYALEAEDRRRTP